LGTAISLETTDHRRNEFATDAPQEVLLLTEEALLALPPRHRLAIVAHCRGNVPIEDLARLFGLSIARTRGIVTEAKRWFRELVCGPEKIPHTRRLKS
jgi:DNA-directed RNA polymerase specialized sigma24 family protein